LKSEPNVWIYNLEERDSVLPPPIRQNIQADKAICYETFRNGLEAVDHFSSMCAKYTNQVMKTTPQMLKNFFVVKTCERE
jgi:hypothetical protein